jgi:predicted Rossmann-fold nucleotide-binding protein
VYGYPLDADLFIFTGMGARGRNVILVRSAQVCVFAKGGMGTLNEFTIAFDEFDESRAIGTLGNSGGLTAEFTRLMNLSGKTPRAFFVEEQDPARLVDRLLSHVSVKRFTRIERRGAEEDVI